MAQARPSTAKGKQLARTSARQSKQVARTAAAETEKVAATASRQAREVASTAKEEAGNVADKALSQGRDLVHEAKGHLQDEAENQTQRLAGNVRELAGQARNLSEGRADDAGVFGDLAQQAAAALEDLADSIETRGVDGMVGEVQQFARRRPGAFLLGAAVAGLAVGRALRGGALSDPSSTGSKDATRAQRRPQLRSVNGGS